MVTASVVARHGPARLGKVGHELSVTIDPRRHDTVLFDLDEAVPDTGPPMALVEKLRQAGVRTAAFAPEAADRLAVRPDRSVVVANTEAGVAAARDAGFALVIGIDRAGRANLPRHGADAVVADLGEVAVRTGDLRMSALPSAVTATDVIATHRPAVFFDFDGTLSDIVDDPDSARLTAGAAEALHALTVNCPVAVLSGRDLADVRRRVGLRGIWYAGSHGFELTEPDGTHHQNDAAAAAVPVLEEAAAQLRAALSVIPGVAVEHKRFGVAVHYRNAARDRVGEVVAAVRAASRRGALRVTTGREVVELRPDVNWDKGQTLRWILGRLAGPVLPVYVGDDITDEDAFDAVTRPDLNGIGIVVRHGDDGDRPTAARFALDNPEQVSTFAGQLAQRIGGGGA